MTRHVLVVSSLCLLAIGCEKFGEPSLADAAKYMPDKLPLIAPTGWSEKKFMDKPILVGPIHNGFQANINMTAEKAPVSLEEYVSESRKTLEKQPNGYKRLEHARFQTSNGNTGIREVYTATHQGKQLRQTFYIFEAPEQMKHIFTCSVLNTKGAELAPRFDEIIRTYKP